MSLYQYALVLWVLLVHWYQPLYVCVYQYVTGTALVLPFIYWYCGYCWHIVTSHSMSLCQYVTGTTLVLLFRCSLTLCTVGTLVPATLCLCTNMHWYCGYCWYIGTSHSMSVCTNMLLVLHWYCSLYVLVLWVLLVFLYQLLYVAVPISYWYCTGPALQMYWYCGYCWYIGTSHSMSLCLYVTGVTLVLLFICIGAVGTVGTLVPTNLCLCTNKLLVLHFYCPFMYWYCGYCWHIGTSHSMSLCQYVTGTTLVLLFICSGTVGTVGTLVLATLCLCTNMLLVLHWYFSLYVLVLWVLLVHWYQPLYVCVPICYWYCTGTPLYMYWYCIYCWYIGTSYSLCVSICYWYWTGTALYMYSYGGYYWYTCTSHSISLCQYVTGTALYIYWYCGYYWHIGTKHPMSLCLYVTGTALGLLFICTGTVGTFGTLVRATLYLCANM